MEERMGIITLPTTTLLLTGILLPEGNNSFFYHCKILGHTVQGCYKLHGYPPGHKLYGGKRMIAASISQEQGVY